MINKIKSIEALSGFIIDSCCENEIEVTLHKDISKEAYVIIKVDDYYNSLNLVDTPPSVDCAIIRECITEGYGLSLVELKNVKSAKNLSFKKIRSKFENTLNDFIKSRFKDPLDIEYINVELFFVSLLQHNKRDMGLSFETYINKSINFNGKKRLIRPYLPVPTIKNCYSK